MKRTGILIRLAVGLVMLMAMAVTTTVAAYQGLWLVALVTVIIMVLILVSVVKLVESYSRKATFLFNAIENHDYTFRFAQNIGDKNERNFNAALNRVKDLITATETQLADKERYYESILDSSSIGILVFDPLSGIVQQANRAACKLLGMSQISHINQLEKISADIPPTLLRSTVGLSSAKISFFDQTSQVTLSISCSKITIRGREMTIAALSDISQQVDQTMDESWTRLSRVLTHEIMNSLAPITSLSEELRSTTDRVVVDRGLEIISTTGRSLIGFIENYRRLTRLAKPVPTLFDLSALVRRKAEMLDRPIDLMQVTENISIVADEDMIGQVVSNLLLNAIEATDPSLHRIFVRLAYDTLGCVRVEFCNDGPPIDRQTAENIFVPFFTTKPTGSGVGLSLSRQIMHLNGGKITHSTPQIDGVPTTVFALQFFTL